MKETFRLELVSKMPATGATDQKSSVLVPPPLLFIHGACQAAWCWLGPFCDVFLEAGWPCHFFSLRSHGASGTGGKRLSTCTMGDYLRDVIRAANLVDSQIPPVVIGHSMGGRLAQMYAQNHPVSALVLMAPVPLNGLWRSTLRFARQHPWVYGKMLRQRSLQPIASDLEIVRKLFFHPEMDHPEATRYWEKLQDESFLAYLQLHQPLRPRSIGAPVLVLGAQSDWLIGDQDVLQTATTYRADCRRFSGLGHDMMLGPRAEDVASYICSWLRSQSLTRS